MNWKVWEHRDHSGLCIGPLYTEKDVESCPVLKNNVNTELTIPAFGHHGKISNKQRELACSVARAVNNHQDLIDTLNEAVIRVEMANAEGNPILSAWLVEAKRVMGKAMIEDVLLPFQE